MVEETKKDITQLLLHAQQVDLCIQLLLEGQYEQVIRRLEMILQEEEV